MKFASVYGRAGFRVVPIHDVTSGGCSCGDPECRSAGKHPRLQSWQNDASADSATIASWVKRYPSANIGLASGADFTALDVDPKNGGLETLAALTELHGELPATPEQTTGSGGKHFLFAPIEGVGNKAGTLRDASGEKLRGLDVRGEGGQIVVAPSVSFAGTYEWVRGREPWSIPLAPAPEWLLAALRTVHVAPSRVGASAEERGFFPPASPDVLEAAELALEIHGPAVTGSGGDTHTFRAGAILTHDYALTEEEAWPLLWAWNQSCQPPWEDKDLATKLRNGAEHGKGEYGCSRSMDAVETARKLVRDWQTIVEPDDASMFELVTRCRKLAKISGDPAKRGVILRELQSATGLNATELALPKPAHLNVDAKPAGAIEVTPRLHEVADAALAAVAPKVFARAGVLCEVIAGDRSGRTFISDLATPRIRDLMSASAKWIRHDEKGTVEQAAPEDVAKILGARRAHSKIRVLEAVTSAPIFLADGSLLTERGYNATARVYLEPSVSVDVPDRPTRADVEHAVFLLRDLVCDYYFAEESDFSGWLAGVLTPLVKSATDNAAAPLFLITAPIRAAGKTKLAQLAAIIATGRQTAESSFVKDPAEWLKKLTAYVRGADPVVILDNLPAEIGDEALDRLLTGSTWKDRILGVSDAPPLPIVSAWWGTGNNTEARSDSVRRVLPIRLEARTERPQDRDDFKRTELIPFAIEYAGTYLSAALTILRGWHCAGRPTVTLPPWASYETWSSIVRQALVWAGCVDPFASQLRASAAMLEPETIAHDFWLGVLAHCDGTLPSIATTANSRGANEVLGAREQLTAFTLPKFLNKFVDRPRGRRRIRRQLDPARYVIEAIK